MNLFSALPKARYLHLGWLCLPSLLLALPGDIDSSFVPLLRENVPSADAALTPDGTVYLWSAHETVDGQSSGGIVKLEPNGPVADVLVERWVNLFDGGILGWPDFSLTGYAAHDASAPHNFRALSDGRLLLIQDGTGGMFIDSDGETTRGLFQDVPAEISQLIPQFERDGSLYFIVLETNGSRTLARQSISGDHWDPEILSGPDWPLPPKQSLPEANGRIRVLGAEPVFSYLFGRPTSFEQKVFVVEPNGAMVEDIPVFEVVKNRSAWLIDSSSGRFTIGLGSPVEYWMYWPSPSIQSYRVEWRNADADLERAMEFAGGLTFGRFVFGEDSNGAVLATGPDGRLRRWLAGGTLDESFASPGRASSLLPLPGGKWLLNGTRRILAGGGDDPDWMRPNLERAGKVTQLVETPDGGLLVVGHFDRAGEGAARGLTKWTADGTPFPGFNADPRLPNITTLAVAPDGGVIAGTGFFPMTLPDGRSSHLIRLFPSGELDESFFPPLPDESSGTEPHISVGSSGIERILMQPDAGFLVLTSNPYGDVLSQRLSRRHADGTADTAFQSQFIFPWLHRNELLTLSDGSFYSRGTLYSPKGELLAHVGGDDGYGFRPLAEMPDGAIIFHDHSGGPRRLRRWKDGAWDETFSADISTWSYFDLAVIPTPEGKLYVWGGELTGAVQPGTRLVRLHRNGRVDPTFRAPPMEHRFRRGPGSWEILTSDGLQTFDPEDSTQTAAISSAWWDEEHQRLWVGGDFNLSDGAPSDGLVLLDGNRVSGYNAWRESALRGVDENGPMDDASGDGQPNLLAYATGGDPLVYHSPGNILQPVPGDGPRFGIWINPDAMVEPILEISPDLIKWKEATSADLIIHSTEDRMIFTLAPDFPAYFVRARFVED